MTAASSGDPGGSRERWPSLAATLGNELGSLTYLQLRSKDEKNNPLMSDPFIVGESVEVAAGGPIEGASTEAQGTRYMLKVRNQAQVNKLLKLTTLSDGAEVVVNFHPNLNISRCVISCYELIRMAENDILHNLARQGVIRVQRITRKVNGERANTSTLILTFNRCNYPSHVKIGLLRTPTRPYYPNPLLCYGCARYGHSSVRCPGPKRCLNCSAEHEIARDEICNEDAHCINCNGPHRPNNRQCPVFKKEMEVIRLKVDHNLTFSEARKRVDQQLGSYAAAAAQQTADRKKLEELEKRMEQKDEYIAHILGEMKKKDEQIEKLMVSLNIKQLPEGRIEQPIQSTETSQPTQSIQPVQFVEPTPPAARKSREAQVLGMQLRNRSPAVTQQKAEYGKKKKRQNRSNNSSPGRNSPPPKKLPADQDPLTGDEDIEIEETPPSQHNR